MAKRKFNDYGTGIPEHEMIALAQCLLPEIRRFFDSAEGKRDFKAWQAEQVKLNEDNKNVKGSVMK